MIISIHKNNRDLYNKEQDILLSRAFNISAKLDKLEWMKILQSKVLFSDDSRGDNSISNDKSDNCSDGS